MIFRKTSHHRYVFLAAFLLSAVVLFGPGPAWSEDLIAYDSAESTSRFIGDWVQRFTLGGYGEAHYNDPEGGEGTQFDLHRIVLYLGYEFSDWIVLHSETEIEHAYVSDGNGELAIEQFFVDFLLNDNVNIRAGRVLAPLGIINPRHEPPTFYGVERPSFSKYIIPTTWSLDGVGVLGNITHFVKYEAYISSSLDGSKFDAVNGIRKGRMKERPGLSEPAVSGRLDFYPLAGRESGGGHDLRIGFSGFYGGLDNGNKGEGPGIDAELLMFSSDFEYSLCCLDFRGVFAYGEIEGAEEIGNNVATDIMGYYVEGAWHFWPNRWKKGRLEHSDGVVFIRYDNFDTQYRVPEEVTPDERGDREEITVGISFYPVHNLVLKADYQFRDDATEEDAPDQFNLGIGWQF